jgi:hypothetical protein
MTTSDRPTCISGFSLEEPLTKPACEVAGLYAAIEHLPLSRVLEMAESRISKEAAANVQ